jgi:hypothetical protein
MLGSGQRLNSLWFMILKSKPTGKRSLGRPIIGFYSLIYITICNRPNTEKDNYNDFIIIVFIVRQVKGNCWIFLRRVLDVKLWMYRKVSNRKLSLLFVKKIGTVNSVLDN